MKERCTSWMTTRATHILISRVRGKLIARMVAAVSMATPTIRIIVRGRSLLAPTCSIMVIRLAVLVARLCRRVRRRRAQHQMCNSRPMLWAREPAPELCWRHLIISQLWDKGWLGQMQMRICWNKGEEVFNRCQICLTLTYWTKPTSSSL